MRAKLGRRNSRVSNCWREGRVRSLQAEPVGPGGRSLSVVAKNTGSRVSHPHYHLSAAHTTAACRQVIRLCLHVLICEMGLSPESEMIRGTVKCLTQHLMHSKCSVNVLIVIILISSFHYMEYGGGEDYLGSECMGYLFCIFHSKIPLLLRVEGM